MTNIFAIVRVTVVVKMCFVRFSVLFLCLLILKCHGLTCRTEGGPKESELKNIYTKCLKIQDGKNASNGRNLNDQEWKESRSHSQRYDRDKSRMRYDERSKSNNDEMNTDNGRRGYSDDRNSDANSRHDRMGNNDRRNRQDDKSNRNDRTEHDYTNGRNNYQNDEFDGDMSQYNGYYSTQSSRRYRRERRVENSGKRSQYNPNIRSSYESSSNSDENSSENNANKTVDGKACALHCFLENLQMIGDDGMPDKYLVNHILTKDVKNVDLKDFLQESIEECFQILNNENTDEKCEFSKSLLMCLSEKGKANCDDWKDGLKF